MPRPHHLPLRGLLACLLAGIIPLTGFTTSPEPISDTSANGDPPCVFDYTVPYHNTRTTCIEVLYDSAAAPEAIPRLGGLVLDNTGTLFFALTALGEVWAMPDRDGDGFPEEPERIITGLYLPTTLAWNANSLYIMTGAGVTRLDDPGTASQSESVLIPGWDQFGSVWPGSVAIGPDERLYISLGAMCTYCAASETARGLIVSYTLDGSNERVEATGLHQPLDFAWHPLTGQLWIGDSAPLALTDQTANQQTDQLLSVASPDGVSSGIPTVTFPYQSTPSGLAFYPYAAFPAWQGDLMLVQRGSWNLPEPVGYALAVVDFDDQGLPTGGVEFAAPTADPDSVYASYSVSQHSLTDQGFFPQHPVDVVVSTRGWIYVAVEEGRILRLRPRP